MNNLAEAMLLCDFYKIAHRNLYKKGISKVYSTWTPRQSLLKNIDYAVSAGQQMFIKKWLINYFNDNFFDQPQYKIISDYKRFIKNTLGIQDPETKHIEELHDLQYLPLTIKSIAEGIRAPIRVPMLTIENTDDRFFWLTNYVETLLSCELWPVMTAATIADSYKQILTKAAIETGGDLDFVPFQGHNFSMRGMMGVEAATLVDVGHLMSFVGTDTIPGIMAMEKYYNANIEKELVGTSIPATEHSIQCSYENDMEYFEEVLKVHPSGYVSIVSDGYDFWKVVGEVLPALKDKIMARNGKVVIRPDSGDPVKIICGDRTVRTNFSMTNNVENADLVSKGLVECLWDIFGGTVNEAGYRVLDSHIGCIYGDSITRDRAREISEQLKVKGFASTNVVYGIGSFTYQYNTRDSLGFAVKSTNVVLNGVDQAIFKDPKTGDGVKKSQKGKVIVYPASGVAFGNDELQPMGFIDGLDTLGEENISAMGGNLLREIFRDGKLLVDESLSTIRERLKNG